ncbi:MAG: DsbA family oxidoreductase [Halioglobus sp.]
MSNPASQPLEVDIVSDVVCPWCIIGYRQFEKSLGLLAEPPEVVIRWHPFELNPQMPEQGQDVGEHLTQKYGTTPEQSSAARERLTALGLSLGFEFDYSPGMRMVNTFRAHQLLHWGALQGRQTELKMALFEAFFSLRQDVNKIDVLVEVASAVGMDAGEARAVLEEGRFQDDVRKEQSRWLDNDIHAVPAFILNHQHMIPGAQDAETFARIIAKIQARQVA